MTVVVGQVGVDPATIESIGYALVGNAVIAALVAAIAAAFVRSATRHRIPDGASIGLGLLPVGLWLTIQAGLTPTLFGVLAPTGQAGALAVLLTALGGGLAAVGGGRLGDRLARQLFGIPRIDAPSPVTEALRAAGAVVAITLPQTVEDAPGYRPVSGEIKRDLAGRTMLVPRWVAPDDRADRIADRIAADFPVAYAHLDDNSLLVGREPATLGSSLPPETTAVTVRTDEPADVARGDTLEIWNDDALLAVGDCQEATDRTATVVVDADQAPSVASVDRVSLTARPGTGSDVVDLLAAVRSSDHTIAALAVEPEGRFEGEFAGWLSSPVLLIEREGVVIPFPNERETLTAGDTVYVTGTPADLDDLDVRTDRSTADSAPGGPT